MFIKRWHISKINRIIIKYKIKTGKEYKIFINENKKDLIYINYISNFKYIQNI